MKLYKSIIALVVVAIMIMSLVSCSTAVSTDGGGAGRETSSKSATETTVVTEKETTKDTKAETKKVETAAPVETTPVETAKPVETQAIETTPIDTTPVETHAIVVVEPDTTSETPSVLEGEYAGQFESNTGALLNLKALWAAKDNGNDTYTITIQLYANSYDLYVTPRDNTVLEMSLASVTAGAVNITFPTIAIEKTDSVRGDTFIGEVSTTVLTTDLTAGIPTTVKWVYNGTYSEQYINIIELSGTIIAG